MTTDMASTQTTTPTTPAQGASPTTTPNPDPKVPALDMISKDDHTRALEKVRTEEKNKLYPELSKLKGELGEQEKELSKLKAEADELKTKLKDKDDSTLTETQRIERRLSDLEGQIKTRDDQMITIKTDADQRVADLELKLYREKKVREAGIELVELVSGSTPEEIDASVERARQRETELLGKAKAKIREDVARELGKDLPMGSAAPTDDAATKELAPLLSPAQRNELSRIRDPQKYAEARARLLQEAHSKLPAGHPLKQAASRG
jgi:predicted ribosome quality control (RQC) complex YloA/Tae2 family protein